MISPITQAQMNNGWLVCLQAIIADFNQLPDVTPLDPLSNGELRGGERSCVAIAIKKMSDQLQAIGADPITPLTNWQINSGYIHYANYLVDNVNISLASVSGTPYRLINATYVDNLLVYTGGLITGTPFHGGALQYNTPPENKTLTFVVPALVGTSISMSCGISSVEADDILNVTDDNSVGAAVTINESGATLSENTGVATSVPVEAGDIINVKRLGSAVEIKLNGVLFAVTNPITVGTPNYLNCAVYQTDVGSTLVPDISLTIS